MHRLCDEVLQLIFYELPDPTAFTLTSKRFFSFSQDPYVRARYFLARYGKSQALYHALSRGKIVTERVLDVLLSSGAHISRYLVQIAIHHYFYTQSHFIKMPWVRNVPLRVFLHLLSLAERRYGEIPRGKSEDDGYIFTAFLKESRFPSHMRTVGWETIKEMLEKYHFMPFCNKDPIMAQFPLVLAIEPRLLPYAVANGFRMDIKYRDFVFRKMFESNPESRSEDIARNVRELCNLDSTMFVSRTVAAEVCMESKANAHAYGALKLLHQSGDLQFDLRILVEDLLKTFLRTRTICFPGKTEILRHLYTDFPSPDPSVRLVILVTIFIDPALYDANTAAIHAKLESLHLTPITRLDIINILSNPFVDRYQSLLDYARREVSVRKDGNKGLDAGEIRDLVLEVVCKCLEVACKGKLVKNLYDGFPSIQEDVIRYVLEKYQVHLGDFPSWEMPDRRIRHELPLCQDFIFCGLREVYDYGEHTEDRWPGQAGPVLETSTGGISQPSNSQQSAMTGVIGARADEGVAGETSTNLELGAITQESLSSMISQDENLPRSRRRLFDPFGVFADGTGSLHYPTDCEEVGRWVMAQFGPRSSVTAVFMTHAILNNNITMLHHYLACPDAMQRNLARHVPVTLKHFQLLARTGRAPNICLIREIDQGAEFYMDENDYISKNDPARNFCKTKVKSEVSQSNPTSACRTRLVDSLSSSPRAKKRPRRSAATVRSYIIPDSDDDIVMDDHSVARQEIRRPIYESPLRRWLKHLGDLCKEEQRKHKEHKRRIESNAPSGVKVRVAKTEFLKSLSVHLRNWRKLEEEKRLKMLGVDCLVDEYSDDDDEYVHHQSCRLKRRKTFRTST
ncbi:hypothetical protein AX16_008081 [Volvariella volvacea WC 439]|nr:hypothetical protein AX16_008081 [Volvariella volvacea WC 439]